jgi:DHA2 family multidrug resistance protein-like MFS transporter
VFLINVRSCWWWFRWRAFCPGQQGRPEQPLNISHAIMLIVAILLLVYSAKTALKGALAPWMVACTLMTGAVMLFIFVRIQLRARADDRHAFVLPSHHFKRRGDGDDCHDCPGGV